MPRTKPFDEHAEQYESWFEKHAFVYRSELSAIGHLLPEGRGLEIGIGSGRFAAPLGIEIGIDPSSVMLRIAKDRGIRVCGAVAEHLPFRDCQFEYAMFVTTICFVDDLAACFREAYRVLCRDGDLVVGFVDRRSPLGVKYEEHREENVFYREASFYSFEEVCELLNRSGFRRLESIQTVFGSLRDVTAVQDFKRGNGEGGFVVIRGKKL